MYLAFFIVQLIISIASASLIAKSYFIDFPQSRSYLRHRPKFVKRENTFTLHGETDAFTIYLTCINAISSECSQVLDHLIRASKRIENVVIIRNQIRLNATYNAFCEIPSSSCNPFSTLGYASPSGLHLFNSSATLPPGIDFNYLYPAALIRQMLPKNDPAVNNSDSDINVTLNSNINWWFSDAIGLMNNGEFGPTDRGTNSSLKSYDFEQVALHEILHGMGFISGWGMWGEGTEFYPSFLEYDDFGQIQGLGPPWIYDKYLSDSINGFWMRDYDSVIRRDIVNSINFSRTDWRDLFFRTDGYKIAKALGTKARGLWSWYPDLENKQLISRYTILNTPSKYSGGSSLSHIDDKYYSGTSQYLMKPSATKNVGLDAYIPYTKLGSMSESVLGVLRSIGYATVL